MAYEWSDYCPGAVSLSRHSVVTVLRQKKIILESPFPSWLGLGLGFRVRRKTRVKAGPRVRVRHRLSVRGMVMVYD